MDTDKSAWSINQLNVLVHYVQYPMQPLCTVFGARMGQFRGVIFFTDTTDMTDWTDIQFICYWVKENFPHSSLMQFVSHSSFLTLCHCFFHLCVILYRLSSLPFPPYASHFVLNYRVSYMTFTHLLCVLELSVDMKLVSLAVNSIKQLSRRAKGKRKRLPGELVSE